MYLRASAFALANSQVRLCVYTFVHAMARKRVSTCLRKLAFSSHSMSADLGSYASACVSSSVSSSVSASTRGSTSALVSKCGFAFTSAVVQVLPCVHAGYACLRLCAHVNPVVGTSARAWVCSCVGAYVRMRWFKSACALVLVQVRSCARTIQAYVRSLLYLLLGEGSVG